MSYIKDPFLTQWAKTCQCYHGDVLNILLKTSSSAEELFNLSELKMMEVTLWTVGYVIGPIKDVKYCSGFRQKQKLAYAVMSMGRQRFKSICALLNSTIAFLNCPQRDRLLCILTASNWLKFIYYCFGLLLCTDIWFV